MLFKFSGYDLCKFLVVFCTRDVKELSLRNMHSLNVFISV